MLFFFFFSSRRRHTRFTSDWSSDVCSSDLHDPVYKVTIIPRGRALGVTMFLPEEDRLSYSKELLESQISSLFGGRIAEELIFNASKVTTGASNDIERATQLARSMVTKWGLSEKLGPLTYSEEDGEVFLGRSVTQHKAISDETAHAIDEEIRNIIDKDRIIEGDLRREVNMNIRRLIDIGSFKGTRHRKNLPVRGQRTRTNARAKRGRSTPIAGRKSVPK